MFNKDVQMVDDFCVILTATEFCVCAPPAIRWLLNSLFLSFPTQRASHLLLSPVFELKKDKANVSVKIASPRRQQLVLSETVRWSTTIRDDLSISNAPWSTITA